MKKLSLLFMTLLLTLSLASLAQAASINTMEDLNGKVIGTTNDIANSITKNFYVDMFKKSLGLELKDVVFFDNFMAQYLALESGKVDTVFTFTTEAQYFVAQNTNYKIVGEVSKGFEASFSMGFAPKYEDLKNQVNSALVTLQDNGTLAKLTNTYLTNAGSNKNIPAVEMPNFPNKPTYTMLVTGTTAPFDILDNTGEPVGFNIAVLSEIAKILQVNFEVKGYNRSESLLAIQSDKACGQFLIARFGDNSDPILPLVISTPYGYSPSWSFVVKK